MDTKFSLTVNQTRDTASKFSALMNVLVDAVSVVEEELGPEVPLIIDELQAINRNVDEMRGYLTRALHRARYHTS